MNRKRLFENCALRANGSRAALAAAAGLALGWAGAAQALSVAELRASLQEGRAVTVIDTRSTAAFAQGHIPGAVNVPESLIPQKRLPPLGRVAVCGEGLGRDNPAAAAAALNAKPGIAAEVLEGGYALWKSLGGQTTEAAGAKAETFNYVTYQDLKDMDKAGVLLVDLRNLPRVARQAEGGPAPRPLTDLGRSFPGARVVTSAFEKPMARQGEAESLQPLYVLIDSLDGKAEETARQLRANGNVRVLILAGGEEILRRDGQPGLQRLGPGLGLQTTPEEGGKTQP